MLQWEKETAEEMSLGIMEEVSDGTCIITRPLTIESSACLNGVCHLLHVPVKIMDSSDSIGYICNTHQRLSTQTFRFAARLFLIDWKGDHLWVTSFDECMRNLLPFDTNA